MLKGPKPFQISLVHSQRTTKSGSNPSCDLFTRLNGLLVSRMDSGGKVFPVIVLGSNSEGNSRYFLKICRPLKKRNYER